MLLKEINPGQAFIFTDRDACKGQFVIVPVPEGGGHTEDGYFIVYNLDKGTIAGGFEEDEVALV